MSVSESDPNLHDKGEKPFDDPLYGRLSIADVRNKELRRSDLILLIALQTFDPQGKGYCYPSVMTLAARAGLSERMTQDSIRQLTKLGYIECPRDSENETGRRFVLRWLQDQAHAERGETAQEGGATDCTPPGVQQTAPRGVQKRVCALGCNTLHRKNKKEEENHSVSQSRPTDRLRIIEPPPSSKLDQSADDNPPRFSGSVAQGTVPPSRQEAASAAAIPRPTESPLNANGRASGPPAASEGNPWAAPGWDPDEAQTYFGYLLVSGITPSDAKKILHAGPQHDWQAVVWHRERMKRSGREIERPVPWHCKIAQNGVEESIKENYELDCKTTPQRHRRWAMAGESFRKIAERGDAIPRSDEDREIQQARSAIAAIAESGTEPPCIVAPADSPWRRTARRD